MIHLEKVVYGFLRGLTLSITRISDSSLSCLRRLCLCLCLCLDNFVHTLAVELC